MAMLNVPDLSSYAKEIENMRELELLEEVRKNIPIAVKFFKSLYANVNNNSNLNSLCDSLTTEGFEYIYKINTILDFLHIITSSQTSKYVYENCIELTIRLPFIINQVHDIKIAIVNTDITTDLDLSQMKRDLRDINERERDILIGEYVKNADEKKKLLINHNVNVFNSNLNQYIVQLYQIKAKLKCVNIMDTFN